MSLDNEIHLYYCPDCGEEPPVEVIEVVESEDEKKIICTCGDCDNLFYVIRRKDK